MEDGCPGVRRPHLEVGGRQMLEKDTPCRFSTISSLLLLKKLYKSCKKKR